MNRIANHLLSAAMMLLPLISIAGSQDEVPLTVVHWNDLHAANVAKQRVVQGDTVMTGGVAALGGYLNHYRSTLPNVMTVNAGDDYQGTPISTLTEGRSQVALLNLLKPDVFAVGNHEFDYTEDVLVEGMQEATFPVLLGNVVREEDGMTIFPPDTILTFGGVKVGIISVMTRRFREVTTKAATQGLMSLPAEETVRASLDRLIPLTDIQIVVSHSGVDEDSVLASNIGPDVDLIIGGHSHSLLWDPLFVNDIPIVQAGSRGRWIGVIDMVVDTLEDKVVSFEARVENVIVGTYPEDAAVAELVHDQESQLADEMDKAITVAEVPLKRSWDGSESNIGNWIADSFREAGDADIGAINQHGIRANVDEGPLTVREVFEVSPFGNTLVRFSLTGAQVKDVARFQASEGSGRLQVSGLNYHIKAGQLISISIGGEDVVDDKKYSVVTVNYVTDHIDHYFGLEQTEVDMEPLYLVDRDVMIAASKKQDTIHPKVEGRFLIEE
ncbi:bifunctional metallophosphatase/5'-nucleotidase [bacterium]|nr:bifunctional metallophosphatase/5'-nucleotidase [bacterium]